MAEPAATGEPSKPAEAKKRQLTKPKPASNAPDPATPDPPPPPSPDPNTNPPPDDTGDTIKTDPEGAVPKTAGAPLAEVVPKFTRFSVGLPIFGRDDKGKFAVDFSGGFELPKSLRIQNPFRKPKAPPPTGGT